MAKIAEAYVDITARTTKLREGLKKAVASTKTAMARIAGAVARGMKVISSKIARVLKGILGFVMRWVKRLALVLTGGILVAIRMASDAEQVFSRFRIVMRGAAKEAEAFAASVARAVGRSTTAIADSMGTFQSFFIGLGLTGDQALGLTKIITQLSLDFASFNNVSDDEALQRFIAALSGSGEVLDRFGINIKQAALEQELLRQGFVGGISKATEQQKVIARLAIIMRAMTDQGAVGNAVETADEFANVLKRLGAAFKTLGVEVGNQFLARASSAMKELARFVEWLANNIGKAFAVLDTVVGGILAKLNAITGLRLGSGNLIDELQIGFLKLTMAVASFFDLMKLKIQGVILELRLAFGLDVSEKERRVFGKSLVRYAKREDEREETIRRKRLELELYRRTQADAELRRRYGGGITPPTLGDLPSLLGFGAGAGGLGKQVIQGIIDTIQTATGSFKSGQRTREVALLEDIDKASEDQVRAQRETTQAVKDIGFA